MKKSNSYIKTIINKYICIALIPLVLAVIFSFLFTNQRTDGIKATTRNITENAVNTFDKNAEIYEIYAFRLVNNKEFLDYLSLNVNGEYSSGKKFDTYEEYVGYREFLYSNVAYLSGMVNLPVDSLRILYNSDLPYRKLPEVSDLCVYDDEYGKGSAWYDSFFSGNETIRWTDIHSSENGNGQQISLLLKIKYYSYNYAILAINFKLENVKKCINSSMIEIGGAKEYILINGIFVSEAPSRFQDTNEGNYEKNLFSNYIVVRESKLANLKVLTVLNVFKYQSMFLIVFSIVILLIVIYVLWIIFYTQQLRGVFRSFDEVLEEADKIRFDSFNGNIPFQDKIEVNRFIEKFNLLFRKIEDLIKQKTDLAILQKQTELSMLQHQINPHFLYNTIEIFRMKVFLNGDYETAEALLIFGKLLRYNLSSGGNMTFLKDELEHARQYIQLYTYKNPKGIKFVINQNADDLAVMPRFILQPVIENAIKHNEPLKANFRFELNIYAENEFLILQCRDNGVGIQENEVSRLNEKMKNAKIEDQINSFEGYQKIGLANINERLKLQYGDSCGITVASDGASFTLVTMKMKYEISKE